MMAPPETSASAAARTFDSASPVRSVSSERWPPQGCDEAAGCVVVAALELELEPLPLAADAIP